MADVLVFDDDPAVGDAVGEALRQRGLSVEHYLSGAGAIDLIRSGRPKLVVLDIMMPGADGLAMCRQIKSTPATGHMKVVIVTAKNFGRDRDRAARYGADLFVPKPLDAEGLAGEIARLLGVGRQAGSSGGGAAAVTILGAGAAVEADGLRVVFDAPAGTAAWLAARADPASRWALLLSRYEDESIHDLPSFVAVAARSELVLAGPESPEGWLQQLSPRACEGLSPDRTPPGLQSLHEGEFTLYPGVRGVARHACHPGLAMAYRLELSGRSVVYCPYHEVNPVRAAWSEHEAEKFRALCRGADLLIHGFRRSLADPAVDDNLGRGAWEPVVELAAACGVRRLALLPISGHFPLPTDFETRASAQLAALSSPASCLLARPGLSIPL